MILPRLPRLGAATPSARGAAPRRAPVAGVWVRERAGGRAYGVYLPGGHRRQAVAPVLLLLHGCDQTAEEFAETSRFTAVADRNGFVVVAPHQETHHHLQRCWHWYEAAHQRRGAGEPAQLVAVVAAVLGETRRWRADPDRVYVAGLSAGGAMALTLAAAYPDVVAAVGAHSAPAYRSAGRGSQAFAAMAGRSVVPAPPPDGSAMAPLIVVQGTDDRVVDARNGQRVVDQWLAHRAAAPRAARVVRRRTDTGGTSGGRGYTRVRWYAAGGRRVLEQWQVAGLGHAWSGGRADRRYSDPLGPRAATVMWGFFRSHRLDRAALAAAPTA